MSNFGAMKRYIDSQNRRPLITKLIEDKVYRTALEELKQLAEDKGYTEEWLRRQIEQLNKEFSALCEKAVMEHRQKLVQATDEYNQAKDIYFPHDYSAADYADLQFMQTLIKTRIMNECQNQPYLVERVVGEYINTQKGARAIMFLANDNEVGGLLQFYYNTAMQNAQPAAEKRFYADKEAELNKMKDEIDSLKRTDIIGSSLLDEAKQRVQDDIVGRTNDHYFPNRKKQTMKTPSIEELCAFYEWYESQKKQEEKDTEDKPDLVTEVRGE